MDPILLDDVHQDLLRRADDALRISNALAEIGFDEESRRIFEAQAKLRSAGEPIDLAHHAIQVFRTVAHRLFESNMNDVGQSLLDLCRDLRQSVNRLITQTQPIDPPKR